MAKSPQKTGRRASPGWRAPSVLDVAKEAEVSVASVSRFVNKPETVGAQVSARVQAAIEKLHYIPDGAGRALITGHTRIVGAVIPHISHSVYADFLEALQRQLSLAGHNLIIAVAGYDRTDEVQQVRQMLAAGAEALMLAGQQRDPVIYRLLEARKIPYVLSSVYYPGSLHPCVGYDNRGAAAMTAKYLLDLGHQRIATITGHAATTDRVAERIEGIRETLAGRGLVLREDWIIERDFTLTEARQAMHQLMSGDERPSAIIGGNDVMAVGALLEAQAMGIKVPDQVSITGFDNTELASKILPSLTTVHVPVGEMGRRAGTYLLGRLQGDPVPHATKIEVNLVLRESTGPAPSNPASGQR